MVKEGITECEAKLKVCPFLSMGKPQTDLCIASACMKWEWTVTDKHCKCGKVVTFPKDDCLGVCSA